MWCSCGSGCNLYCYMDGQVLDICSRTFDDNKKARHSMYLGTYNATLRRVGANIVAVEKQYLF